MRKKEDLQLFILWVYCTMKWLLFYIINFLDSIFVWNELCHCFPQLCTVNSTIHVYFANWPNLVDQTGLDQFCNLIPKFLPIIF